MIYARSVMLVLEAARRILLGSKIDFVIFACARLCLKIFSLGSLELEKFTLVPNTSCYTFFQFLPQKNNRVRQT